jgi:hypothetical protein
LFTVRIALGQQIDFAFGMGTVTATSAGNAGSDYSPQSVGGGAFPVFSGDVLLRKNLGVNGEVAWRAGQNSYTFLADQPFRPLFYDFNGIWVPKLAKRVSAEVMAGIGAESVRFYQTTLSCGYTGCTDYSTDNHFMGHFGGGIRLYVLGNLFVRPEAHVYLIHNNNEFSGPWATRYGASVGYTFGGRD